MVQSSYGAGAQLQTTLTGSELVDIDNGGAVKVRAPASAFANLSGSGVTTDITATSITTNVGTTLPAAAMLGGLIVRSGPTASYTDTTDTAANILAAIGTFVAGSTFFVNFKNFTAFTQTISAGAGVTMPGTNVLGPYQEGQYYGVIGGTAAAPTVTFNHILTSAISLVSSVVTPQATALNTVGAGTILAPSINGGITLRGGVQVAAFTDTTDIAANIIAGNAGLLSKIGSSFLWTYNNNTGFPATVQGGVGVTVSVATTVPPNAWATYLVTYTAANTITMVGVSQGHFAHSGTFVANGATPVTVANAAVTANSTFSFGINTIGGTPLGAPYIATQTAGTGFTVKAGAGDTSTYSYTIWS